jgi:PAS domain S-box-containing protein
LPEAFLIPVVLFLLSIGLQLAAAVSALLLIRITGRRLAWISLSLAMVLMLWRRIVSFVSFLIEGRTITFDLPEVIGLIISALMLAGVLRIGTYFNSIRTAEMTLKESEERFRTLIEQSPDMIGVLVEGRIVYLNPAGLRLFGAERSEQMMNKAIEDYMHPDDLKMVRERIRKATETARPNPLVEMKIFRIDGALLDIEGVSTPFVYHGQPAVQFICRDITERKKSEELIRNILESVDEGFIIIDRDFRIISANRAFADEVKTPVGDIIGKHCYEVSHHSFNPCYEAGEDCSVRHVFETGEPHAVVHTHFDAKGNHIYIETKAYPLSRDESGKVMTAIEILIDITEKRKLEEQLRHMQKMDAIGQLAGGIAHDFNNILTAIVGYGHIALMKMAANDPQRLNIEHMLEAADRAARLTQNLLVLSRKQIIDRKPADLNVIIRTVEKLLLRIIGEDIKVETILHEGAVDVFADSGQIEQVLMNLATNARDAMLRAARRTFTIETEIIELDDEFVKIHGYGKPGAYALITATDTGIGMDNATRERIFEPFFTTKEFGKGTGLGLSIVYGIIKQHDGYINCYSEINKGTAFKIYLPVFKTAAAKEAKPAETAGIPPARGTETILLAEDEESVRRLIRDVLKESGYKVIEAFDGEEAVSKFMENKDAIDLLLLDVVMRKMSGREAYEIIKKVKPEIKLLMTSGYSADFISKKGMLEEGLNFLAKPMSPANLLKKVREALDK